MRAPPQKKLIPGLLLAMALAALAAPPLWWSQGNPPVIAPGVPENNQGPANIGQAKHIVSQALLALDTAAPTIATQIRADLIAILDLTVPDPKTPEWTEKQKAPLLIGQLKAIADPFYTRLHAAHPNWLEAERTANSTNHPGSIFPWTTETTDDNNKAIANIGQLKAVFSLRFDTLPNVNTDTDGDGMPDDFEIANGLNPNDASDANSDADNDGLTNSEEHTYGTNPNNSDSDEDGITDGSEIDQNTSPNDPTDTPAAEWFILTGDLDVNEDKARSRTVTIPAGESRLLIIALHSEEYPYYTGDQSEFNDILEWSVTPGEEDPVTGIIDVNSYHDLWILSEIDGVEIQNFAPAHIESTETLTAPGDADLEVEIDLTATNIGDGVLPSTVMVGLLPVEVDYIGRDPDTGEFQNLGGVVDSSDPRPVVDLETATATIKNNGSLEIEISGTARDYMSELLEDGTGAVTSLQVFLDGELVDTIGNLPPANAGAAVQDPWLKRDSTVSFSKTITVPDITPGLHNVVVRSNANALGKQGWDGASILIEKQNYSDVPLANAPAFSVLLSGDLGSERDSITLQSGAFNAVLTEPEGMEDSGVFVGQMTLDGVAREIQVGIARNLKLDENQRDDLGGEIMWQDGTGGMNLLQAIWKETTATSKLFTATATLATVESWTNLQVTSVTHQQNPPGRGMNPFVVRLQAPEGIEFFGEDGILKAKRNGEEVEFKEHGGMLGEDPPAGMKWYFLHVGDEPQVFCLNDKLAGSIHAPAQVLDDGQLQLELLLMNDESTVFEDKSTVNKLYDIPEIAAAPPLAVSELPQAMAMAASDGEDFTMDDVRYWFEMLFEDAGMNLLSHYESGNGNDSGLNVSLEKLWAIDNFWSSKRLYKFDGIGPSNMSGEIYQKQATLCLNRFKIKSPVDGAVALFSALQELRGKDNRWLRTGLETNWTTILDAYAAGTLADQNVEQALRQGRLAPIASTVSHAKSAFELGFSFVPFGGDLIISVNDIDTALSDGDKTAVAVAFGAILIPEILERTIKYAKRTSRTVKWDFKAEGVMDWTVAELEILYAAGVGKRSSRIKKMDSLRPYIESGELVLDEAKIKALRSNLYLDPPESGIDLGISPDNSRAVLRRQLGMSGNLLKQGKEAHHDLPICSKNPDLELEFLKRGIDPNKAEHGRVLDVKKHDLLHGEGTTGWLFGDPFRFQWFIYFRRNPEAKLDDIRSFRDQLRELTDPPFSNADDLDWPYPKTTQP